jgi:flagellar motor switch protein FliG
MTEATAPAILTAPVNGPVVLSGPQKVAALMITIGTTAAARILKTLPPESASKVATELMNTRTLRAQVRDQVLEETYAALFTQMHDLQGGSQYALELFVEAFGEAKGMALLNEVSAAQIHPPFEFLLHAEPSQVAQLLSGEHAQTSAIVLAHLEPRHAAKILTLMDPSIQVEVARRIATTEQTTPEAVALVEDGISRRMSSVVQESTQVGGRKPLAQVLNQVDRTTEKDILGKLADLDPELADEVRRFMFTFEDIALLDDRSMQRLLRDLDQKDLALALRDERIPSDLKAMFFRNMSQRAADMLNDEMSVAGQVRRKNVEEAQGRIVEVVKRLEEADEIIINRGGDDGAF